MTVGSSLSCEDGTEFGGTIYAHAFFDTTQVMPPGRLDLDIVADTLPLGIALHVHGELDAHLGSGTVSMIWPLLTEHLRAQRCQTGDQRGSNLEAVAHGCRVLTASESARTPLRPVSAATRS